jgi:hypothetical protein
VLPRPYGAAMTRAAFRPIRKAKDRAVSLAPIRE